MTFKIGDLAYIIEDRDGTPARIECEIRSSLLKQRWYRGHNVLVPGYPSSTPNGYWFVPRELLRPRKPPREMDRVVSWDEFRRAIEACAPVHQ